MITIAFLAGQLGLGGAERQLYYLISGLDRQCFTPIVINLNPNMDAYWSKRMEALGITIVDIPHSNFLRRIWHIKKTIDQCQPDIVHSFHFYVNSYSVITNIGKKRKLVGGMRTLPTNTYLKRYSRVRLWLGLYGVDRLVCNSITAQKLLHQTYPILNNLCFIPNGGKIPSDSRLLHLRQQSLAELGKTGAELWYG